MAAKDPPHRSTAASMARTGQGSAGGAAGARDDAMTAISVRSVARAAQEGQPPPGSGRRALVLAQEQGEIEVAWRLAVAGQQRGGLAPVQRAVIDGMEQAMPQRSGAPEAAA